MMDQPNAARIAACKPSRRLSHMFGIAEADGGRKRPQFAVTMKSAGQYRFRWCANLRVGHIRHLPGGRDDGYAGAGN